VLMAAEVKVHVDALWVELTTTGAKLIERQLCWDFLLKDDELAYILGQGSTEKGSA